MYIQYAIPAVVPVLIALRSYNHARHAFPEIDFATILIETDQPAIGSGTKRKHWKRMREMVNSRRKMNVVLRVCPNELAILVIEGDAIMSFVDCLIDLNGETDGSRHNFRQHVGVVAARLADFPLYEARSGSLFANLRRADGVTSGHR